VRVDKLSAPWIKDTGGSKIEVREEEEGKKDVLRKA
jgi:hypothetical protein